METLDSPDQAAVRGASDVARVCDDKRHARSGISIVSRCRKIVDLKRLSGLGCARGSESRTCHEEKRSETEFHFGMWMDFEVNRLMSVEIRCWRSMSWNDSRTTLRWKRKHLYACRGTIDTEYLFSSY